MMTDHERPLKGGNATARVVRIGATVRKPRRPGTPAVVEYLTELSRRGIDVPASLGTDAKGRQVIEFVPGHLAMEREQLTQPELMRVGRLVRAIHDASDGFTPPASATWEVLIPTGDAELICHNDLAPWNLIVGERWVFIDWDGAGPSTRLWDLAYAAQAFTLNDASMDPCRAAGRLAAFVNGYGAAEGMRASLPQTMAERTAAMHQLLVTAHRSGREPWASMYRQGHGAHWLNATQYVERHAPTWSHALSDSNNTNSRLRGR